jgi:hypothetical protein
MARLYSNENFPFPVVEELRRLGHDVLTTEDVGRAGQAIPDEEVLGFALQDGRILLTLNRKHFIRMHLAGIPHGGLIACTFDADFLSQAARIHDRLGHAADWKGRLERVNRPA